MPWASSFPVDAEQSGSPWGVVLYKEPHGARALLAGELLPRRPQALSRAATEGPLAAVSLASCVFRCQTSQTSESPEGTGGATWRTSCPVIHAGCGLPRFMRVRPMLLAFTVSYNVLSDPAQTCDDDEDGDNLLT